MNIPNTMRACMILILATDIPGKRRPFEIHEVEAPDPDTLGPHDVFVELYMSGACVTNLEMVESYYGHAPLRLEDCLIKKGGQHLVGWLATGHEGYYRVIAVGKEVTNCKVGDLVAITVRPGCGKCRNCLAGHANKCVTGLAELVETGIHFAHGSDVEYKIIPDSRIVVAPKEIGRLGVFAEPFSICSHSFEEAVLTWRARNPGLPKDALPATALILGNGPIGLGLAATCLKHGILPIVVSRTPRPCYRGDLAADLGAVYISLVEASGEPAAPLPLSELLDYLRKKHPEIPMSPTGFEFVFEATGDDRVVAQAHETVADGGVEVWTSITGKCVDIPAPVAKTNLFAVLGNKSRIGVVNANGGHFADALDTIKVTSDRVPGWCDRLLTHPFHGIEGCQSMLELLGTGDRDLMKTFAIID